MKEILKYTLTLSFLVVSVLLIGQSTNNLKVPHSLKDKKTDISINVEKEGTYEVLILSPNGEIQSQPIKNRQIKSGGSVKFNINSKYWNSGEYRVLLRNNEGLTIKSQSLIIELSEKEKQRLRNGG